MIPWGQIFQSLARDYDWGIDYVIETLTPLQTAMYLGAYIPEHGVVSVSAGELGKLSPRVAKQLGL